MFIPLLQTSTGNTDNVESSEELGGLQIVLDTFRNVGLDLNLFNVLLVMLFFFTLKGVARFGADYYRVILRQRFANTIRLQNMRLLAGYDFLAFTLADSGRIQNIFSGEVERITKAYATYFGMLQSGIMTAVYVGLAYLANPRFAFIVAIGGLLSNFAFSKIYKVTKETSRAISKKMNEFQGFLIQSVASFKFLKATGLIDKYRKKINRSIKEIEEEHKRVGTMVAIATAMREPLIVSVVVVAILIQVTYFQESIGLIILSLLFFYRGLTYLVATQNLYNSFLGLSGSIENVQNFVVELKQSQERIGDQEIRSLSKNIVCRNLKYTYGDKYILNGIDLRIEKFETVGIVGGSGVGKTTLVNILSGLLPVESGMLYIDGADSVNINLKSYRSRLGYVTQEAHIFNDTVFNNVSFWDERNEKSERKVIEALSLAHAADFVHMLPNGIDTELGINGINLSGGQRQRISIARELYREVDILVLDEATSSLDTESEQLIQENVESLSGSYTMLIIAHRLSTIRNADKIIHLLDDGTYRVGTFTELMTVSPGFRRMVDLQTVA